MFKNAVSKNDSEAISVLISNLTDSETKDIIARNKADPTLILTINEHICRVDNQKRECENSSKNIGDRPLPPIPGAKDICSALRSITKKLFKEQGEKLLLIQMIILRMFYQNMKITISL